MNISTNINMVALPYSIIYTDKDYDSANEENILNTKGHISNIIKFNAIRNLYTENIKDNITLFNVVGNEDYFGNGISSSIGQISINNAQSIGQYKIYNIDSWTFQESSQIEDYVFPSTLGCVYCPRTKELYQNTSNLHFLNFLGVYDSYIYYNYSYGNNYTKTLYCQNIDNPSKKWIVDTSYNIYLDSHSYPVTDNTGIYLYHDKSQVLAKYSFDNGEKLWEYSCNISFLSNIQNERLVMLDNTVTPSIIILNSTNGSLIKKYVQSYFTLQSNGVFVDCVNGYILLYEPYMDKTNSNRIIILNSDGNVFLNLSITSSSTFWSRISGNYVWKMAIDKDSNLWIINSDGENYYLTKVTTTASGIGTKQWEVSIPEAYVQYPEFYQDERIGGMYIFSLNSRIFAKHNASNGGQLFCLFMNNNPYFDKANQGMVYFQENNTVQAIRDNSYAINYYKTLFMS